MKFYKEKPVLCDVDGILCDYVGKTLSLAKELGVSNVPSFDEIKYDTRKFDYWKEGNLDQEVMKEGFCSSLPIIPGSQNFIEKVRSLGLRVVFLTSPYKNHPYWHWERFKWLEKHFNVKREDLIFATDKRYVNGLTFIDDHIDNVVHWQEYQDRPALLMKRPWNESILEDSELFPSRYENTTMMFHKKTSQPIVRTNDWNDILEMIEVLKYTDEESFYRPQKEEPSSQEKTEEGQE